MRSGPSGRAAGARAVLPESSAANSPPARLLDRSRRSGRPGSGLAAARTALAPSTGESAGSKFGGADRREGT